MPIAPIALILSALVAPLQETPGPALGALDHVVDALRADDPEGLAALVDFALRSEEARFRASELVGWEDLDGAGQLFRVRDTVEAWLGDQPAFLHSALLHDFRSVEDPDAGQGPLPDRVIVQAVLRSVRDDSLRDLLLYAAPDGRIYDLELGPIYLEGANPAGPGGLQPVGIDFDGALSVHWPQDVDRHEKSAAEELVGMLLTGERLRDREMAAESLHRSPRAGVTAVLRELATLHEGSDPDTGVAELLVQTLTRITGRSSDYLVNPRFGMDEGVWRARNQKEVASWVRWHDKHGGSFVATAIENPLVPVYDERPGRSGPRPTADAGSSAAESKPPLGTQGRAPEAPSAGATPPPPAPSVEPTVAPASEDDGGGGPRVSIRNPPALDDPADDTPLPTFPLLVVGEKGEPNQEYVFADVADQLDRAVAATLKEWAPALEALELRAALGSSADHVILGRADDAFLADAARKVDEAADLLRDVLPERESRPLVVLLFDQGASRTSFYRDLVDDLWRREIITFEGAEDLRSDPRGFTARTQALLVQPVWDMAGDAAAGDDEFRLANELAHKYAQVALVERCGPLPEWLLWGMGHLTELRLQESVYTFRKDGFVAVGDHFDWGKQTASALEKRRKRRSFSLLERILGAEQQSNSLENPMLAWGTLDYLFEHRPVDLTALLDDLSELQRMAAPRGGVKDYLGDPTRTESALTWRLNAVDLDALLAHLEGRP